MSSALVLGNFEDKQTALYIFKTLKDFFSHVNGLDIRMMHSTLGHRQTQEQILIEIKELEQKPSLILLLKGLELDYETIKIIKETYPEATLVNWFFDKYLFDKPIWEEAKYFSTIGLFDHYFCSLKGVADKLNELGLDNVLYLDEACFPELNGEAYFNHFESEKYGEDISFAGSLGFFKHHPKRVPLLEKLAKEGFNMKIWGPVICEWKYIPPDIRMYHMIESAINEKHSIVSKASKINLGIDQDLTIDMGYSARLYRVMCAGGLYLSSPTKGLSKLFKCNAMDKKITTDQELVVYYNTEDLIEKIDFLLEHEDIRQQIALNGQKCVLDKHTFKHRISEMLQVIKNAKRKTRNTKTKQ